MKDSKGFISIFLVIILSSFVVLTSLIVEGAHTHTAVIQGERATSLAMRSILAEYNVNLKKEYGLFAIEDHAEDNSELDNKAKSYIDRMLQSADSTLGKHNKLYQFSVEKVTTDLQDYSLLNQAIYKEQILEAMKYSLLETEIEKLDEITGVLEDISSILKIVNQFQDLVVLIREIENQINNLQKYCEGWYIDSSGRKQSYLEGIKSFLLGTNEFRKLNERYLEDTFNFIRYECVLNILDNIKSQLVLEWHEGNISEDFYSLQIRDIHKRIKDYSEQGEKIHIGEYVEFFESRIDSCDKALKAIKEMKGLVHRIASVLDSIHSLIEEMGEATSLMREEINEAISGFIKVLQACSDEKLTQLEHIIGENKGALEDVRKEMMEEKDWIHLIRWSKQYQVPILTESMNLDRILQEVDEKIKNDGAYALKIEQYTEKIKNLTEKYNTDFIIDFLKMIYGEEVQENHEDSFPINNLQEENEKKEKSLMSDKGKRVLRNSLIIQGLPSQALEKDIFQVIQRLMNMKNIRGRDIRDELVINAYILKHFNHALSQHQKEREEEVENFFQNEVEYILYGSFDDQRNAQHFLKDLLLLRSALNLIHIYSDHEKKEQTLKAALAMTKGVGAAVAQFAIASAWSYAEALIDAEDIQNGKKSPFLKNRDNWNLEFENIFKGIFQPDRHPKEKIKDEESLLQDVNMMDYKDYLMLFLLPHQQEVALYRALDVTQINIKTKYDKTFDVRDYYTGCKVKIDFTVKPLFLNATWMFEDIKNRGIDKKHFFVKQAHDYY